MDGNEYNAATDTPVHWLAKAPHPQNGGGGSLVPSPSHPQLLSNFPPSLFLHGCEIKAGVGRTGNEAGGGKVGPASLCPQTMP